MIRESRFRGWLTQLEKRVLIGEWELLLSNAKRLRVFQKELYY
jgi:hypothetical protein